MSNSNRVYDYIVVGAGPGGGPLAANLAKAGYSVALLEAGLDPMSEEASKQDPSVKATYEVPGFFGAAAEHPLLSWEIYVSHFANVEQQKKDKKYVDGRGILYPRGSCLGGSVAHNALIWVYPHDSDFDDIARTTGDASWASEKMRGYYERVENCQYCGPSGEGHGHDGYIATSMAEEKGYAAAIPSFHAVGMSGAETPEEMVKVNPTLDVNHPSVAKGATGYYRTPMNLLNKKRVTVREHLVKVQAAHPDKLDIITNALATKVVFEGEGDSQRAAGIEYMHGGGQSYKAHKFSDKAAAGEKKTLRASREVILCGGAFNTPQLLKLSGIGPKEELQRHGIDVRVDLPGVGTNLQDRYEVPVVLKLKGDDTNPLFGRCTFEDGDPAMESYETGRWVDDEGVDRAFSGPYAGNNLLGTRIAKSSVAKGPPDLFFVGLPLAFYGYYPGFSTEEATNHFSWNVLKAHTENTAGTVTLRSADPTDVPEIVFRFFDEGNAGDIDMKATLEGVRMIREDMAKPAAQEYIVEETAPGKDLTTDAELADFARETARGHHASCTAKIGAEDDATAVLDSRFRVRGVDGLRVVDASVFPKTPGFFPAASVFMISEKASDVIIEDAQA